jgi:methylglutaconyl-CoA hydratase
MSAINQGHVNFEINDSGIATIEFGHPLSNSLPGKILNKLAKTITDVGAKNEVKVIVLKSTGERAFCALMIWLQEKYSSLVLQAL